MTQYKEDWSDKAGIIKRLVNMTLFHRTMLKPTTQVQSFFNQCIGLTDPEDGHIILATETNLTTPNQLARGQTFLVYGIDVAGISETEASVTLVELVIGISRFEHGPLDVIRSLEWRTAETIDGLHSFQINIQCVQTDWIGDGRLIRVELKGTMLIPVM